MRRIPALVLTLVAIIAAVFVDRSRPDDDAVATPFASERETWMPAVAQGPGAVNWYCPGVPADGDGSGGGVVIANTTNAVLTGRYEVLTPDGAVESEVIDLPAYERLEIDVGEMGQHLGEQRIWVVGLPGTIELAKGVRSPSPEKVLGVGLLGDLPAARVEEGPPGGPVHVLAVDQRPIEIEKRRVHRVEIRKVAVP